MVDRSQGKIPQLSKGTLSRLEVSISTDRLSTYLQEAQNDKRFAIALYEWNTRLSENLHGLLQGLEITLKNAIHSELQQAMQRPDWYEVINLREEEKDALSDAKERIAKEGKAVTPSRVVAALHLGFWVALTGSFYAQALWDKHLHRCFRPPIKRNKLYSNLNSIKQLRNRIAHYEPIFQRPLERDYEKITSTIRSVCPTTETWVVKNSRFLECLQDRPAVESYQVMANRKPHLVERLRNWLSSLKKN